MLSQELGFNDSKWEAAHQVARNGAVEQGCPWIPVQTMPKDAYWIWSRNYLWDVRPVFCRGYTSECASTLNQGSIFRGGCGGSTSSVTVFTPSVQ